MIPTFPRSGNGLSPSFCSSFTFVFFLHALVKELLWQQCCGRLVIRRQSLIVHWNRNLTALYI